MKTLDIQDLQIKTVSDPEALTLKPAEACDPEACCAEAWMRGYGMELMKQDNVITAERVRILYKRAIASFNTAIVGAFIFAYIFREQIALPVLLAWLGFMSMLTLVGYWLLSNYNKNKQNTPCHDKFENRFAYAAGLVGIGWAFIIVTGLNLAAFKYHIYSLLLLVTIISISVPIFSSSIKTIYFYITPPLVVSVPLLLSRGSDDAMIGLVLIMLAVLVMRSSKYTYTTLNEALIFRFQTQEQAENMEHLCQKSSVAEQSIQAIMDNSPAVIYVKDTDGRFIYVNHEFLKLFHMQREDIIGKTLYAVFPKEIADEMRQNDLKVQEEEKPLKYEEVALHDDGPHNYISSKFPLFDEAGKLYAVGGVSTDITERFSIEESLRISQQRLLLHRDQSPVGVIEWNTDFTFNDWNPAAEKIFGFTKDEVQGKHVTDRILPECARPAVNKIWQDLLANRGGTYSLNENITKDGRTILCEWHNTPLVDHDGHVIGVTSIVDDVTERIAAKNAQLEKEKAEAATQAKSQFLANMSHEIRTPLTTVLGMAKIGARDSVTAKSKETFNHILDSGQHLLSVIDDILEFSKIEASKLSVESRPFQLVATIEDTVNMIKERAWAKNLKLSANVPSDLPRWVIGDPLRLQQILLNLLSNAIKFTSEGEVLISLSRDGDMTHLKVTDTGIGLNEEQISRLFTSFEQADASTTRKYGGTGLGLSISYNLAQLMGGDISVESQINEGSVFTLNLPLAETKAPEIKSPAEAEISQPQLKGLRVLVAEDVEINRMILDDMFGHEGASTVFAEDGQQAIDRLRQIGVDQIDVILMDVQMPVMDGYEATRRILEMAPDIPIIGVTAHALKEERDKCLAAGMVAHVTKPYDPGVLVSVILRHV